MRFTKRFAAKNSDNNTIRDQNREFRSESKDSVSFGASRSYGRRDIQMRVQKGGLNIFYPSLHED
jgi:hypothetical protein